MSASQRATADPIAPGQGSDQSCVTCRYAQNRTVGDDRLHCRRYPPTWTGHQGHAVTPIMDPTDWCGEYQTGVPAPPTGTLRPARRA